MYVWLPWLHVLGSRLVCNTLQSARLMTCAIVSGQDWVPFLVLDLPLLLLFFWQVANHMVECRYYSCTFSVVMPSQLDPHTHMHTYTHTHAQMETLNATVEELHSHSKTLKNNQELTFTEPMKKFAFLVQYFTPLYSFWVIRRFNNVYKHVEFHAKQRELKLQVLPHTPHIIPCLSTHTMVAMLLCHNHVRCTHTCSTPHRPRHIPNSL